MRDLAELMRTPTGRRLLTAGGITDSPAEFEARARSPVYAAHQVFPDFRASVVAKFRALRDLAARGSLQPLIIWADTDRAGSDQASMSISWHDAEGEGSVRLAPHRFRDREIRFVPFDVERLDAAFAPLSRWAAAIGPRATERLAGLERSVRSHDPRTLAAANQAMAEGLLAGSLGLVAPSRMVSDLLTDEPVRRTVEETLRAIDDVILVFNQAVENLRRGDVDPQVNPVAEDYLPLFFSCPRDGLRRRLVQERNHADRFAVAGCRCGAEYRFHLGNGTGAMAELAATGRWSVDVTLPMYLNDLVGGTVVGRSSALYGLVLNEVAAKVLGRSPVPMLVPSDLPAILAQPPTPDSLLDGFLRAP